MKPITAIIIDDEQLAREAIKNMLSTFERIKIVGECGNGFEGFKLINDLSPDLIFLDVKMPKLSGFEMLELLDQLPVVIFSTAYDQYAIKAFEFNAVDYLLKPYSKERFNLAVEKAIQGIDSNHDQPEKIKDLVEYNRDATYELTRLVVKTGSKIHIVSVGAIHFFEAMDDYVRIHTETDNFIKQITMKFLEDHLSSEDFIRCHRSYIVNVGEILKIEPFTKDSHIIILKNQKKIPVSRSGLKRLKEILHF